MYTERKKVVGRSGPLNVFIFTPVQAPSSERSEDSMSGVQIPRGREDSKDTLSIGERKMGLTMPTLLNQVEQTMSRIIAFYDSPTGKADYSLVDEVMAEPLRSCLEKVEKSIVADEYEPNAFQARVPLHYTEGMLGGGTSLGKAPVDFDLSVLCIAAWFRRTSEEREQLMKDLAASEALSLAFTDEEKEQWLAELRVALGRVNDQKHDDAREALGLKQVTEIIRDWNDDKRVLRGQGGEDLLEFLEQKIRVNDGSINRVINIFLGDLGKQGSITGWEDSYDPLWMSLNTLRHWSAIGREGKLESKHLLFWMERRDFENHVNACS